MPAKKDDFIINEFNRAIRHAIEQGTEAAAFLRCWQEGDWDGCREFEYEPGTALTNPSTPQPADEPVEFEQWLAGLVPEGYQLVPVEPTNEMAMAGLLHSHPPLVLPKDMKDVYKAMIKAATPQPAAQHVENCISLAKVHRQTEARS